MRIHATVVSMLVLAALVGAAGAVMLSRVESVKEGVIQEHARAFHDSVRIERLHGESERLARLVRGYLIRPSAALKEQLHEARAEFDATLAELQRDPSPRLDAGLLARVDRIEDGARSAADRAMSARDRGVRAEVAVLEYEAIVGQSRERLDAALTELARVQEHLLEGAREEADAVTARAATVFQLSVWGGLAGLLFLGALLARQVDLRKVAQETAERRSRELERIAAENARLYADVRRAVDARDEVLAVVAHDLRAPLNAIVLAARALERMPAPPAARPAMETLLSASSRMDRLIDDLLDVARLDAGAMSVAPQAADAAALVQEAVDAGRSIAGHVRLEVAIASPLPHVSADRDRIQQVFSNLLGNAAKFTPPGGRVEVGARREGGSVRFWVRDSGPGIDPGDLPHVFDRFWQAGRADRRGVGLGLAIARAIVLAHGGSIHAESPPGEGASFVFTLPLARSGPGMAA